MKKASALLILFTLMGMASSALADCKQYEAQVIGRVTSHTSPSGKSGQCVVKASFSYFNTSLQCPLDKSTAQSASIMLGNCPAVGETISGVLVDNGSGLLYLE